MSTILVLTMCVMWAALVWYGDDAPGAIWRWIWLPVIALSMLMVAASIWASSFGRRTAGFATWDSE